MNEILRTPPERFANLPGFPWSPHSRNDLVGFAGFWTSMTRSLASWICAGQAPARPGLARPVEPNENRVGERHENNLWVITPPG